MEQKNEFDFLEFVYLVVDKDSYSVRAVFKTECMAKKYKNLLYPLMPCEVIRKIVQDSIL